MSYVITHPEKMDDARQQQWQKLAHLTDMDMNTINNLELLGVPVKKRGNTKSGLGLTFGRKRKRAVRKVTPPPPSLAPLGSQDLQNSAAVAANLSMHQSDLLGCMCPHQLPQICHRTYCCHCTFQTLSD